MDDKSKFLNRWSILIFVLLAFISGIKFHSFFIKPIKPVETVDIARYESDFRDVHKLISQNTLAIYGVADTIINSWIHSLALKQDGSELVGKILSDLESNGAKTVLARNNDRIEEGMKKLKKYPFKYREAYKVLEETYALYAQFYKFTLNPSVSLIIYSKHINELEAELAKNFSRLALYAPKAVEGPRLATQLALAEAALPSALTITTSRPQDEILIPMKLDDILGKSSTDVEKMMGPPQSEVWAQGTGAYQRQYQYNGEKINVYYRGDQVTGLSN